MDFFHLLLLADSSNSSYDEELFILFGLWTEEQKRNKRHSRYQKEFYKQLHISSKRLRDRRIPRIALQDPQKSSWRKLLESGSDQALITLTGFDFETFNWLSEKFTPVYENTSPWIGDRIVRLENPSHGRKRFMRGEE